MPNNGITLGSLLGVLSPTPQPKGIYFNHRRFSEPTRFRWTRALPSSGLYAVLVIDGRGKPRPYRAIYFGQGRDLAERVTNLHEKYSAWCKKSNGEANLYLAFHWMPGSTEQQRTDAESELIRYYNPECNIAFKSLGGSFSL